MKNKKNLFDGKKVIKKLGTLGLLTVLTLGLNYTSLDARAATNDESNGFKSKDGTTIVHDGMYLDGDVNMDTSLVETSDYEVNKKNVPTPRSSSVVIRIPFQTQQNDYYCGPAAAKMVLGGIGYHRTQNQMASLLGTTRNGTPAGNRVANALNSVVAGSKYKFRWVWHKYSDVSKIKGHVLEALNYGNPVMVNTVESPGDVYLVGHNTGRPFYHYGVVADYFNYGNTVTYTDPGYGRYPGFRMDQRVSITGLSYAVGGRGYAW